MLMNYVALVTDVPLLLHFTDHYHVDRAIADPDTGKMKWVNSLVFQVDEVNKERTSKTFSVLSTKLASQLEGYLADWKYRKYDFRITKTGVGFAVRFSVEALPRAGAEAVG